MEKNIHRVRLRVFFHDLDDDEKKIVEENYKKLMPYGPEDMEKIDVSNKNSEGLIIREVIITKNRLCNTFFENLISILGSEINTVLKDIDLMIDEDFYDFYIRLDKETLKPITGGNCFHIKITPAAFPKTKENVKKKMLELFSKFK